MEIKIKGIRVKRRGQKSMFFHKMVNARRNLFTAMKVNGRRLTRDDEIKEDVVTAFQRLVSESDG